MEALLVMVEMCICIFDILMPLFQSQEKEARDEMKRKAKELQLAKREARKEGRSHYTGGFGGGGFGSHDIRSGGMGPMADTLPPPDVHKHSYGSGSRYVATPTV